VRRCFLPHLRASSRPQPSHEWLPNSLPRQPSRAYEQPLLDCYTKPGCATLRRKPLLTAAYLLNDRGIPFFVEYKPTQAACCTTGVASATANGRRTPSRQTSLLTRTSRLEHPHRNADPSHPGWSLPSALSLEIVTVNYRKYPQTYQVGNCVGLRITLTSDLVSAQQRCQPARLLVSRVNARHNGAEQTVVFRRGLPGPRCSTPAFTNCAGRIGPRLRPCCVRAVCRSPRSLPSSGV
jgi:hypothetical protein